MKRKLIILVISAAAIVPVILFFYLFWGSTVPTGQQLLVRLNNENFASLKEEFNKSPNDIRVMVMLSPT